MFFKMRNILLQKSTVTAFFSLFLSMVILISGCNPSSLPLGESPAKTKPQDANLGFEAKCLKNTFPVLQGFVDGSAKPEELSALWNCLGGAIDLFYRKTKTKTQNEYQPQELAKFLQDYFLEDTVISDDFMQEAMRLKVAIAGGNNKVLNRSELKKIVSFIDETKSMTLLLLPHMPIYALKWSEAVNKTSSQSDLESRFKIASEALSIAAQKLGDRLASNGQSYSLRDFSRLLIAAEQQFGRKWGFVAEVERVTPLIEKLKKNLIGGVEWDVTAEEWRNFVQLGAKGYTQYLRYRYFLQDEKLKSIDNSRLRNITTFVDEVLIFAGEMIEKKPSQKLTTDEIQDIANEAANYFKSQNGFRSIVLEVMKIKKVVFGGSIDEFVLDDFRRAHVKLEVIRKLAEQSLPYLDVYLGQYVVLAGESEKAKEHFQKAALELTVIAKELGGIFEDQYDLQDLKSLIEEISPFFNQESENSWAAQVQKYFPVAVAIKNIILNDQNTLILRKLWPNFAERSAEIYNVFLYYKYFLKNEKSLFSGSGLENLDGLIHIATGFFDNILSDRQQYSLPPDRKIRRSSVIRISEWTNLIETLESAKLLQNILPQNISAHSLRSLLSPLFNKILQSPRNRLNGERPDGLTSIGLSVLREEWALWMHNQKSIQSLFNRIPVPTGYSAGQVVAWIDQRPAHTALSEMRRLVIGPRQLPLVFDSRGRLTVSISKSKLYTQDSLEKLNLARLLSRVMIRSYALELSRIQNYSGLRLSEAESLFSDFRQFAVQLGLIDQKNTTFISSRFREANLFSAHANGDELLSFNESTDLIQMIQSGLKLHNEMKRHFLNNCPFVSGYPEREERISMRCFIRVYRQNMTSVFTSMPEFARNLSQLPSGVRRGRGDIPAEEILDFDLMIINLLKATGWADDNSATVRLADTSLMPHIFQYVETVIVRFDQSQNGILEREEAMQAYPVFRDILKSVAKFDREDLLRGVFSYILVYGKPPETVSEKLKFITVWVKQESSWPIYADRKQLAKVLGFIADAVAKEAEKPKESEFKKYDDGIDHHPENPNK